MATATRDAAALTADPLLYQLPEFPSAIPITPNPAMSPCESDGIPAWVTVSGAAFPAMVMGGEPRVPVHLLISRVLLTQGVSEIQAMMEDLNIHKSIATHEQAERLRKMDAEVSSCHDMLTLNLVTRSDAERLCGIVRIESMPSSNEETVIDESERLEVQHNVFGTVKGWVYPSRKGGRSVRCQECKCLFTPEDFVAHSHSEKKESQRTVHWGFDPTNWRLMIELSNPLTESIVNKERWKEFIDDTVGQSCSNTDESCGFVVNKAKRLMSDHSMEVPSKVARGDRDTIEKPVAAKPVISESSDLFNMYLQDSLNRLLGPKQYDPLALLGDVMRKESAFKVKSLATMDRKSSSNGQLFPVQHQPYSTVPHPSSFQELDWKAKQLRSNCGKLETVEAALKNAPGVDPSILTTLQEIKASLIEGDLTDYERLRASYEFLFIMFRQLCDPLWCIEDPLMRAAVAGLRSDHVVMGVSLSGLNDNSSLPPAALSDSSQQQLKLAQLNRMGSSATKTAPVAGPAVVSSATDPHLMQQLLAQLLVPNMAPPQHS